MIHSLVYKYPYLNNVGVIGLQIKSVALLDDNDNIQDLQTLLINSINFIPIDLRSMNTKKFKFTIVSEKQNIKAYLPLSISGATRFVECLYLLKYNVKFISPQIIYLYSINAIQYL